LIQFLDLKIILLGLIIKLSILKLEFRIKHNFVIKAFYFNVKAGIYI